MESGTPNLLDDCLDILEGRIYQVVVYRSSNKTETLPEKYKESDLTEAIKNISSKLITVAGIIDFREPDVACLVNADYDKYGNLIKIYVLPGK